MSEWISVKASTPEENQRVVFADIGHGQIYASVSGKFWHGCFIADTEGLEASNYDGGAIVSVSSQMEITHWMPLPTPPKD